MTTSRLLVLLLVVCGCASLPPTRVPVGTKTFEVARGDRKVAAMLWFPAPATVTIEAVKPKPIFKPVPVAQGAEPALAKGERRPLVIFSAGNWGTVWSQGWLATRLVEEGYLVVSISHPGTNSESQTPAGRLRLWDRARDVTAVLDEVLAHSVIAPWVDSGRIGLVGHSFGGWTAVALAGGVYRTQAQGEACRGAPAADLFCASQRDDDVKGVSLEGDGTSVRDARIRAFALLAPGPSAGFTDESLQQISSPMLVLTADQDEVLPAATHAARFERIPGARTEHLTAGHFDFIPQCNALGKVVQGQLCGQVTDSTRAAVHERSRAEVVRFLDEQLAATRAAR